MKALLVQILEKLNAFLQSLLHETEADRLREATAHRALLLSIMGNR